MPNVVKHNSSIWAALLYKEWCEQRWRFFLATIVVSGLLAGLLRAQVIPSLEAEVLIYGPVGMILVIFLAAGPVASERADRTWDFLAVQPVSRSNVILAKWAMGVLLLTGTMVISTAAGLVAMWSRGMRLMPHILYGERQFSDVFTSWSTIHPELSLCAFAVAGTITLACWFTPLYLLLTRARNEFAATLGGVFLTIAALLWLMRIIMLMNGIDNDGASVTPWLAIAILNPLSPFLTVFTPTYANWLLPALVVDLMVWIVLPLWWTCRNSGRVIGKWVNA
jgi:ABC-type transport system involved in multi-copper enzyme maturation permease subunit